MSLDGLDHGANGLFTGEFIRVVGQPGLTISQVFDRVRIAVDRRSGHSQVPWVSTSLVGEFRFYTGAGGDESANSGSSSPGQDVESLFNEADSLFQKQDYRRAVAVLTTAIGKQPDDTGLYHLRGQAYARLKEFPAAIRDFDAEILRLKPESQRLFLAYHDRGATYRLWGKTGVAIEDLTAAIRLKPDSFLSFHERGVAHQHRSEYDPAMEDYSRAIQLKPDYVWPYFDRSRVYLLRKEFALALKDLDQAIRLEPSTSTFYLKRAEVKEAMRDREGAKSDREKARSFARN